MLLVPSNAFSGKTKAEVEKIRHWSASEYTRVVIDVSKEAPFTHHLLRKDPSINKPRRLYVDIAGARLNGDITKHVHIDDGLLKSVRAGQNNNNTVRVVLDIESIDDYRIFHLTEPYRIVIDVTGSGDKTKKGSKATGLKPKAPLVVVPVLPPVVKKPAKITPAMDISISRIVIDAGHGGKDPGAVGKRGLREKDVTLKIAKMLKKKLEKSTKAKIILTRSSDKFIPLKKRTSIANKKNSDLFISIHVNSSKKRTASGVETYYLDFSHDKRVMKLAARENAASGGMSDNIQFILGDLIRTANREDSSRLAWSVQSSLVKRLERKYSGVRGNGVKGAPFYVLTRTNMPSILVEVSFISNSKEEKRLKSSRYLQEIVAGITKGVVDFMKIREAA